MAAIRIQTTFYTDQNVRYRINIWDNNWSSATLTTFDNNGFELEYDRCEAFLTPLIPSSCYVTLIDDGSSNFASFKSNLANAQENQFKLYIEKYVSGAWVIDWAGIIMSDMVSWDNDSSPRYFEIVAKDGLNRLEGIYFDKLTAAPYSTDYVASLKKIIFDCLSYSGTAQFWNGSSKPYIACDMYSHDTLQTGITQADILSYVHIGKEFLIDDPAFNTDYTGVTFRGTNDHPLKTNQILSDLMQLFRLRIFLSEGSWRIQEVNKQSNDTYVQGEYDYLGAYTGSSTQTVKVTENSNTLALLSNGKFGYYPPIRSAKAKIYPSEILNGNYNLGVLINKNNPSFTSSTFQLGKIYGGSGSGLKLIIQINYDVLNWFYKVGKDFYVEYTAKIVANTNRITNSITSGVEATVPYKGGGAKWSTTSADKYTGNIYYAIAYTPLKKSGIYGRYESAFIETEEIPFAGEDCSLVITASIKSISGSTTFPNIQDLSILFRTVDIQLIDTTVDPPIFGQITEIELQSPYVAENSIQIDYGLLRIADNLGTTTKADFNSILVTAPNNAGTRQGSTTWVAGHTVDTDIVTTLLKETIALQKTSIKKYTGSYRSTIYNAWNTISYDGVKWVFMGGRYNAKMDEWNGEWFAIVYDNAVIVDSGTRTNDAMGKTFSPTSWHKPIGTVDGYPVGAKPVIKVNTGVAISTSTTSFTIDAAEYDHVRKGDTVMMLNPLSLENIQNWTIDANCEIGDTTLTVLSDTTDETVWQTFMFAHEPREYLVSNIIRASNQFQLGGSQNNEINRILKVLTVDTTTKEATTNGSVGLGSSNRIKIPDDSAIGLTVTIVGKVQNTANCLVFIRQALIYNDSGTTSLDGSVQTIGTDIVSAGLIGSTVTISANNTNDCLKVEVKGIAATNINWTVNVKGVVSIYA